MLYNKQSTTRSLTMKIVNLKGSHFKHKRVLKMHVHTLCGRITQKIYVDSKNSFSHAHHVIMFVWKMYILWNMPI